MGKPDRPLALDDRARMALTKNLPSIMSENNLEQVNNRLDRVEEILVAHSERMDTMTQAITQLTHIVEQAHERHEQSLSDHERRITMMEEVQRDTRQMLQILINRTTGENPT